MKILKAIMFMVGILFGSFGVTLVLFGGLGGVPLIMGSGFAIMLLGSFVAVKGME